MSALSSSHTDNNTTVVDAVCKNDRRVQATREGLVDEVFIGKWLTIDRHTTGTSLVGWCAQLWSENTWNDGELSLDGITNVDSALGGWVEERKEGREGREQ